MLSTDDYSEPDADMRLAERTLAYHRKQGRVARWQLKPLGPGQAYITVAGAMARLGCSRHVIMQAVRGGELPVSRGPRNAILIHPDDWLAYCHSQQR